MLFRSIWFFTRQHDDYLRYSWLASDLVTVEPVPGGWRIRLHMACSKLEKTSTGLWSCSVYDQERPSYCTTYPLNFLDSPHELLQREAEFCPALKTLLLRNKDFAGGNP